MAAKPATTNDQLAGDKHDFFDSCIEQFLAVINHSGGVFPRITDSVSLVSRLRLANCGTSAHSSVHGACRVIP